MTARVGDHTARAKQSALLRSVGRSFGRAILCKAVCPGLLAPNVLSAGPLTRPGVFHVCGLPGLEEDVKKGMKELKEEAHLVIGLLVNRGLHRRRESGPAGIATPGGVVANQLSVSCIQGSSGARLARGNWTGPSCTAAAAAPVNAALI